MDAVSSVCLQDSKELFRGEVWWQKMKNETSGEEGRSLPLLPVLGSKLQKPSSN